MPENHKLIASIICLAIIVAGSFASASAGNLDFVETDVSITANSMASILPEEDDPNLSLNLGEDELVEGNTAEVSTLVNIKANTEIDITIEQTPEEFEYDVLNQGIEYKFEFECPDPDEGDDDKDLDPGDMSGTETSYENISSGVSELTTELKFDPEGVEEDWWTLPATEEDESYDDVILKITVSEAGP